MSTSSVLNNVFENVGMQEDQTTEFKRSIFFDPATHEPSFKQMLEIARTMAAFMNADGGMLYVGISDGQQVKGIEEDLNVLAYDTDSVKLTTAHYNDEGFVYHATPDHYELKIRAIAKAFLSANAGKYIGKILVKPYCQKLVCRIELKACPKDDFVYAYHKDPKRHVEVTDIYVRSGNKKDSLFASERDDFIRERVEAGFESQLAAVRAAVATAGAGASGQNSLVSSVRALLARIDSRHIAGAAVTVSGGQPFTEVAVTAANKPKALAWEGAHYAEVSGWQMLVLKVLEKLQEINAAKFDELVDQADFRRHLIKVTKPREKHGDCYPTKFGADGKVRIKKSLGNKVYLWQEDKVLRKIIAAFGVDVSKFMFVAE